MFNPAWTPGRWERVLTVVLVAIYQPHFTSIVIMSMILWEEPE
jgi:hypothetical protein